jgi:hypothetical protein
MAQLAAEPIQDTQIRTLLAQSPDAPKTHLAMDCLNIHQSEALD